MPTLNKTTTIKPGECFTLPRGAVVVSVSGILTNSCDFELPTPEALKCYKFEWELTNNVGSNTQAWDHEDVNNLFTAIVLNNVSTVISTKVSEPCTLRTNIDSILGTQGVLTVNCNRIGIAGDRDVATVVIKTLPSIAANLSVKVDLSGSNGDIRIFPVEITCP